MTSVTTAQMAIYSAMLLPVLFLLFKHGKPGFLGWFYFNAFCLLRILGGALALSGNSAANIIANVGLSPLLLSSAGIIHESSKLRRSGDPKVSWSITLSYHLLVSGATAVLAIGAASLQGPNPHSSDLTKIKIGIVLVTVTWVVLLSWSVYAWLQHDNTPHQHAAHAGRQLNIAVFSAAPFIGVRVLYSLVAFVSQKPSLNPATGSVGVHIGLILIPELITTIILLVFGWRTRNALSLEKDDENKNAIRLNDEANRILS